MTILNNGTRNQYTATSGQTTFIYNFEIFAQGDIVVYKNTTLLSVGTHYTVTGVGVETGGTIVLVTGATTGDALTIFRDTTAERLADYQNSGAFLAAEINADLDRIWAVVQEQNTNQSRFLQTSLVTEIPLPVMLEDSVTGQLLRWKNTNTIDSVSSSNITASGEITTDFNRNVSDYAALRLINTADFAPGQAIEVTDAGISGTFYLRNSVAHGRTDNDVTIIVIDADWYAERGEKNFVTPEVFGALGDGATDDGAAFVLACDYCYLNSATLVLSPKNYIGARVEVHGNMSVQGNGASVEYLGIGTTLIAGTGTGAGAAPSVWPNDPAYDPSGYYDPTLYTISTGNSAGDESIVLSSVVGLSVGDLVFLCDTPSTASSVNNYIPKVFEFNRIKSIATNTVTFYSPLKEVYSTSGALATSPGIAENCSINDLKITTEVDAYQYVVRSAYNVQLNNIEFAGKSAAGAATFCENLEYNGCLVSRAFGPISQARGTVSATFRDFDFRIRTLDIGFPSEDVSLFIEESFYNINVENFRAYGAAFSCRQIDMAGVATKRKISVNNSVFDTRFALTTDAALQNGSMVGADITYDNCTFATADEATPISGTYPGITGDAHNWSASSGSGDVHEFRGCKFYSTASTSSDTAYKTGSGFQGTTKFDDYCTFDTLSLADSFTERGAATTITLSSPVTAGTVTPQYKSNTIRKSITLSGLCVLNGLTVSSAMFQINNLGPEVVRYFTVACIVTGGGSWASGTVSVSTSGIMTWLGSQSTVVEVSLDGVEWQTG